MSDRMVQLETRNATLLFCLLSSEKVVADIE